MRKTSRTTGKALRRRGALGLQGRLGRLFLESGVINLTANFLLSTGLLGLLCLALPDPVRADTVYTYTGKAYTDCLGVYCTGGPFALNVTFDVLAGTPLDNLTLGGTGLITADVSTFSFTDGTGLEISLPTATSYSFDVATDSSGNLLSWFIFASTQNKTRWRRVMNTENTPLTVTDFSDEFDISGQLTDFGANSNTPGSWSVTITPEPAGYMLIGAGLLGILALALTKQAPAYTT